jgi:hypothetical protein
LGKPSDQRAGSVQFPDPEVHLVLSGAGGSSLGAAVLTRPKGMPHEKNATSNRKGFIVADFSLAEFGRTFIPENHSF